MICWPMKNLFGEITDLPSFTDLISSRFMGTEFLTELEESDPQWQKSWKKL